MVFFAEAPLLDGAAAEAPQSSGVAIRTKDVPQASGASADVEASGDYISGDYQYTVSDGKATITNYTGSASSLTIPSSLGGIL